MVVQCLGNYVNLIPIIIELVTNMPLIRWIEVCDILKLYIGKNCLNFATYHSARSPDPIFLFVIDSLYFYIFSLGRC